MQVYVFMYCLFSRVILPVLRYCFIEVKYSSMARIPSAVDTFGSLLIGMIYWDTWFFFLELYSRKPCLNSRRLCICGSCDVHLHLYVLYIYLSLFFF